MTKKKRKPTRRDLLVIITRLQGMIGTAHGEHFNDRSRTAFETAQRILKKAHELCIDARSHEDPVRMTGPWAEGHENDTKHPYYDED